MTGVRIKTLEPSEVSEEELLQQLQQSELKRMTRREAIRQKKIDQFLKEATEKYDNKYRKYSEENLHRMRIYNEVNREQIYEKQRLRWREKQKARNAKQWENELSRLNIDEYIFSKGRRA